MNIWKPGDIITVNKLNNLYNKSLISNDNIGILLMHESSESIIIQLSQQEMQQQLSNIIIIGIIIDEDTHEFGISPLQTINHNRDYSLIEILQINMQFTYDTTNHYYYMSKEK